MLRRIVLLLLVFILPAQTLVAGAFVRHDVAAATSPPPSDQFRQMPGRGHA